MAQELNDWYVTLVWIILMNLVDNVIFKKVKSSLPVIKDAKFCKVDMLMISKTNSINLNKTLTNSIKLHSYCIWNMKTHYLFMYLQYNLDKPESVEEPIEESESEEDDEDEDEESIKKEDYIEEEHLERLSS